MLVDDPFSVDVKFIFPQCEGTSIVAYFCKIRSRNPRKLSKFTQGRNMKGNYCNVWQFVKPAMCVYKVPQKSVKKEALPSPPTPKKKRKKKEEEECPIRATTVFWKKVPYGIIFFSLLLGQRFIYVAGFKVQRISSGSCSSLAFDHGMYIFVSWKNIALYLSDREGHGH